MDEITLQLGQKYKIKGNIFTKNYSIVYTGKTTDNRFSIGLIFSEGYQALSYNMYFRIDCRKIDLEHAQFDILHVNDESLRFRVTKK